MKLNRVESPNKYFNRLGYKPAKMLIVNHITEGSATSCINWFQNENSQASTHFLVAKDGTITQFMDLTHGAWGNGTTSNPNSTLYYKHARNEYIRSNPTNANLFTISIEHEGKYAETHGSLTEAQYQATLKLHKHIISEVKRIYDIDIPIDREHIIGHIDVTPISRPHCPGEKYPFDRLIKDLKGEEKMCCKKEKRYNKIDEMPKWAKPTIQELVDMECLKGDEDGNLDLTKNMLRIIVILIRFIKKLLKK